MRSHAIWIQGTRYLGRNKELDASGLGSLDVVDLGCDAALRHHAHAAKVKLLVSRSFQMEISELGHTHTTSMPVNAWISCSWLE